MPDAIRTINRQILTSDDLAQATNPDAMSAPEVTEMVSVYDLHTRSWHFILVHRLDYRPQPAPAVGNVVVFSEPAYAPCRAEKLQLATPAYYRDHEDLEPGLRDHHDGTLTRDGTRWASSIMGGTVRARLSFVSSDEPWVYCASHYRTVRELRCLRSEFRGKYGYSAATRRILEAWRGPGFKVLPLEHGPRKSLRDNVPKVYNRGTGYRFLFHRQPGTGICTGCLRKKRRRNVTVFPSLASCSNDSARGSWRILEAWRGPGFKVLPCTILRCYLYYIEVLPHVSRCETTPQSL